MPEQPSKTRVCPFRLAGTGTASISENRCMKDQCMLSIGENCALVYWTLAIRDIAKAIKKST